MRQLTCFAHRGIVALAIIGALLAPSKAFAADSQVRPFIGSTFRGGTTFVDLENAAGKANVVVGVSLVTLGDIFGVDIDLGDAPGFFQSGEQHLVLSSRVTTLTGNIVIAAPRKLTEYTLRPYIVGGAGLMRVRATDYFGALQVNKVMPGLDVGGGVVGFITNRVGVAWEVRRFQTMQRQTQAVGLTFGEERLSFWRASMALAIRY